MSIPPEGTVHIDVQGAIVSDIIDLLLSRCKGPREAFGVLVVALLKLDEMNAVINGSKPDKEALIESIKQAIETAERVDVPKAH